MLVASANVFAQITLSGNVKPKMNTTERYSLSPTSTIVDTYWSVSGGSITNYTDYYADILWDSGPVSGAVFAEVNTTTVIYEKALAVNVVVPNPAISGFTVSSNACGAKTISYSSSPPSSGINWYWQTSSSGTSINYPGNSYTQYSSGYAWVRAKYGSTWSLGSATSPYVTITNPPSPPSVNHNNPSWYTNCDYTISITNPQGGYTYNWYTTSTGGTPFHSGTSLTINTSTTGYQPKFIESVNNSCPSSIRTTINLTVSDLPTPVANPGSGYTNCDIELSVAHQTGFTFNWYSAPTGGTLLHTGRTYTVNKSTAGNYPYYVSGTNANGCVSVQRATVNASVYNLTIPSVSAFKDEPATLSISASYGSSIIWYDAADNIVGTGLSISPSTEAVGTFTYKAKACVTGTLAVGTLTVHEKPSILSSTTPEGSTVYIGPGETISLTADNTYSTYSWKKFGAEVATEKSLDVSEIGDYTLTISMIDQNGTLNYTTPILVVDRGLEDQNINYIETNIIQIGGITSGSQIDALTIGQRQQSIQYFDGLGRPVQSMATGNSPNHKDIVQPVLYDEFGRENLKFLPSVIAQGNGRYKPGLVTSAGIYNTAIFSNGNSDMIEDDTRPFSETIFEESPLNRPIESFGPGNAWYTADKSTKMEYLTNVDGTGAGEEKIIIWKVNASTGFPERENTVNNGYYNTAELIVQSTTDEEGRAVREYTDKSGRTILKKVQYITSTPTLNNPAHWAQTYYIYDELSQLRYVFQPELSNTLAGGSGNPSITQLNNLAFQYKYDGRKRMIEKRVPGSDWVYMVYDERDRLVFTQDANQRANWQWMFTKYDQLNRPIITGIYTHSANITRDVMKGLLSTTVFSESYDGVGPQGYSNTVLKAPNFVEANFDVLTVTYYDGYNFKSLIGNNNYNYDHTIIAGQYNFDGSTIAYPYVKGQVTGSKTKVLGQSTYLWNVSYFDDRYRLIQSISTNTMGGTDRMTNLLDAFNGKLLETITIHNTSTATHTTARRFEYDHADRLLFTWYKANNDPEILLSQNEYNELGQLVTKKVHLAADPEINQTDVNYSSDNITANAYNGEKAMIAKNSITLQPGFHVTAGEKFTARLEKEWSASTLNDPNNPAAQTLDYRYNIRGWLTRMNNSDLAPDNVNDNEDYFGMNLLYEASDGGIGNTQLYNGNISAMKWSARGEDASEKAYTYGYDALNRITGAAFKEKNATWASPLNSAYSVNGFNYDKNGNITSLIRKATLTGDMDNLVYAYGSGESYGNQLLSVTDSGDDLKGFVDGNTAGNDYAYDSNGNMVTDKNKGLDATNAISYNHLNLPDTVTKSSGEYIRYIHDATGRKLRQEVYNASNELQKSTDYQGEFIYENDVLQFINNEEGRIVMTGSLAEYQYHLKDHLGNVRVSFTTRKEEDTFTASLEDNTTTEEQNDFGAYTRTTNDLFDHTDASTAFDKVHLLTGGYNSQVGLTKSFSVLPGDTITAEVYAKYLGTTGSSSNIAGFGTALLNAFGLPTPGGGETGTPASALYDFGSVIATTGNPGETASWPKGWLNILVFDKNYELVDASFQQLDGQYIQPVGESNKMPHQLLTASVNVTKGGYAYIYVSNEGDVIQDIYFDDFKITHTKSPVFQADDYYPFGLTFNSYQRENNTPNQYQYNGKELQNELGINWVDYGARMYMPEIGRWGVGDPLADKIITMSQYNYAINNPINWIDKKGEFPIPAIYFLVEGGAYAIAGGVLMFYATNSHAELSKMAILGGGVITEARSKSNDPYWAPFVFKNWKAKPLYLGQPHGNDPTPQNKNPKGKWIVAGAAAFASLELLADYQNFIELLNYYDNIIKEERKANRGINTEIDRIYNRLDVVGEDSEEGKDLLIKKEDLQKIREENNQNIQASKDAINVLNSFYNKTLIKTDATFYNHSASKRISVMEETRRRNGGN